MNAFLRYQVLMIALILGFATLGAPRAWACSCSSKIDGAPGSCKDLKRTGPAFVGTVIDIENPPNEARFADQSGVSRYRFRVDENIEGFPEKEIDIYSGRGGADCSYHFHMGEAYLVTPYKPSEFLTEHYEVPAGSWMAIICSETQTVVHAGAFLEELKARKRGSTIEGIVRTKQPPAGLNQTFVYDSNSIPDHGMPNIKVELRGKDKTVSAVTDVDGMYRFSGIPPGEYRFALKLPADFPRIEDSAAERYSSITISEQTCYAKDIDALRAPRIAP
jgi:hypothetical protein